ncbi:lactonase family protein [Qingshengfaniella alkalisoli]|uniref:Lactonase family protein n=1 Tax=Qingshengfaniella alkalisoli TaxID=2599296 RepID=A0A5B8I7D6_9RHOB|nr:beta-propeller fold lactonase family protein [Qingshengfaniella alkalisoli]QDY69469.1 lactonase family protein [Qingshengfaniella alkalisoli]
MEVETEGATTPGGDLVLVALAGQAALALCTLDPATGGFSVLERLTLPEAGGTCRGVPMAARADGERIYLAWRGEPFRLYSFALNRAARRLECLGSSSLPASMCYLKLSLSGRHVLTSSNVGSVIAVSPIDDSGCAGEPVLTQEAHKAHCVVPAPNGLVYATSLRGDFVQCCSFDAVRGGLAPLSRLDLPVGSGPRHLTFTEGGARAYLLSEFMGLLSCLDVDDATGALSVRQSVSLFPGAEKARAAELRLGSDQTHLYASERNTSRIFTFRLDAAGGMHLIGAVPAPECPTAFDLSRCGRYLIALGEASGEVWSYRIRPDGLPDLAARVAVGAVPSWVLAL